jgi:hypothetical protein
MIQATLFLIEGIFLPGMGTKATSFRGRLMLWITAVVAGGIGLSVALGLVAGCKFRIKGTLHPTKRPA